MGGVDIPWKGAAGAFDADVLLHAIADGILRAMVRGYRKAFSR
jgi:2C-methyl-D-erythritol 2,4-cyclodiphosphate synthase